MCSLLGKKISKNNVTHLESQFSSDVFESVKASGVSPYLTIDQCSTSRVAESHACCSTPELSDNTIRRAEAELFLSLTWRNACDALQPAQGAKNDNISAVMVPSPSSNIFQTMQWDSNFTVDDDPASLLGTLPSSHSME